MPNGKLNQKTHGHEIATSAPPSTGPITRPTAATIRVRPHREPELVLRERVGDERGRVREQEGAADALGDAPQDQLHAVGGEAGAQRGEAEHDEAGHVGALAAEQVGQAAGAEHQHRRGDHVREDHPHECQQAGVQLALEVGQGDDERARVDRGQEHPQARARQHPPPVVLVTGVDAGSPPAGLGRCGGGTQT